MTGLKIVLPSAFTDISGLSVLRDDARLTAGSLVLIDPAHPADPWAAGTPADADTVPNIAWKEAAAVIGSGTQSSLKGLVTKPSQFTGSVGTLERSGKGGLHVIMSASGSYGTGKGIGVRPPLGVSDWIVAHPTHSYYLSVWQKVTRFTNGSETVAGISLNSTPSAESNSLVCIGGGDTYNQPSGGTRIGYRRSRAEWRPSGDAGLNPPFADPVFANIAVTQYSGTPNITGSTAQAMMKMFSAGACQPFNTNTSGQGWRSAVLWSAYLEDLTVSGRSYATVDGLDFAEYTKQCLTTGGRYYGDTYTTPALA